MGARTAVVLTAGLGTRMRPLTDHLPKPALPFLNRPAIHWTLEALERFGVEKAFLNLHHLPEEMETCARVGGSGMVLRFFPEPEILGTAGLFGPMRPGLEEPYFFVVNGDVWGDLPVEALSREMEAHPECLAALALQPMPPGARYTPVAVDGSGILRGFGTGEHFFTGIYAARPELLETLPERGFRELVKDVLRPLLPTGRIRTANSHGAWFDLGSPTAYLDAQFAALEEVVAGVRPVPTGSRLEDVGGFPVLRHETATVSSQTHLTGSLIVGPRCSVPPACALRRTILLQDARLSPGETLDHTLALGDLRVGARRSTTAG